MHDDRISILVLNTDAWGSLKAIRCLAKWGQARAYVLSRQKWSLPRFSRFCCGHYTCSDNEWLDTVQHLIGKLSIAVLFPIGEKAIERVLRSRTVLPAAAAIPALPSLEAFDLVRDKWAFHLYALADGIPVPFSLCGDGDAAALFNRAKTERMGFPMLVKPTSATGGGRGVRLADSWDQLVTIWNEVQASGVRHILQEYIPGVDICLCAYCLSGHIVAHTIQISLDAPHGYFGPQRAMRFVEDQEVNGLCAGVVSRLNWDGLICIDLRRDSRDGSLKVLEVNPRMGQAVLGSLVAGVNMPLLACLDAVGVKPPPMRYRPTVYLHPRESWRLLAPHSKALSDVGWRNTGLVYALPDPLPELAQLLMSGARWARGGQR